MKWKPVMLPCAFYRTLSGQEPVREWLRELPAEERRQIGIDIMAVQYGWPLGLPLVDALGQGLWEIRSRFPTRIARTLFCVQEGVIVLLHGFIKKTRSTPIHEIELARRRMRDVKNQPPHRKQSG